MTATYISAEMKAAVGTVTARRVSYPVSESDIRKWAIAVYFPEPPPARFLRADATPNTRRGGITAPEDFNAFAWATVEHTRFGLEEVDAPSNDPKRTELVLGITPPDIRHMLNGGVAVEYGVPVRPGDVLTSTTRLGEYSERPGRMGLMLFSTIEETVTNQHDELVKRSTTTLIRY